MNGPSELQGPGYAEFHFVQHPDSLEVMCARCFWESGDLPSRTLSDLCNEVDAHAATHRQEQS